MTFDPVDFTSDPTPDASRRVLAMLSVALSGDDEALRQLIAAPDAAPAETLRTAIIVAVALCRRPGVDQDQLLAGLRHYVLQLSDTADGT